MNRYSYYNSSRDANNDHNNNNGTTTATAATNTNTNTKTKLKSQKQSLNFKNKHKHNRAKKSAVVKILIIGDHHTGKTSIAARFKYKEFITSLDATIGMDIVSKYIKIHGEKLHVQLWDIAGQDTFIGLTRAYYKNASAAVVVFDITSEASLMNARKWKTDLDNKVFLQNANNIPCVLFANKWDLVEAQGRERCVNDDELEEFCNRHAFIGWFSSSAKSGLNVKKGMYYILERVIENTAEMAYMQQRRSTADLLNIDLKLGKNDRTHSRRSSNACCVTSNTLTNVCTSNMVNNNDAALDARVNGRPTIVHIIDVEE